MQRQDQLELTSRANLTRQLAIRMSISVLASRSDPNRKRNLFFASKVAGIGADVLYWSVDARDESQTGEGVSGRVVSCKHISQTKNL